jgi:hypothetical protein
LKCLVGKNCLTDIYLYIQSFSHPTDSPIISPPSYWSTYFNARMTWLERTFQYENLQSRVGTCSILDWNRASSRITVMSGSVIFIRKVHVLAKFLIRPEIGAPPDGKYRDLKKWVHVTNCLRKLTMLWAWMIKVENFEYKSCRIRSNTKPQEKWK